MLVAGPAIVAAAMEESTECCGGGRIISHGYLFRAVLGRRKETTRREVQREYGKKGPVGGHARFLGWDAHRRLMT